jgi:hypothetical protein
MSADSEHPLPSLNSRGPDEDQDQILAWEMTAFPAEDEPLWEELEYLEYLDDTEGVDDALATHTSFASGAGRAAGFGHGGAADAMSPGPVLAGLADRVWRDGLDRLDDDELTGILQAAQRLAGDPATRCDLDHTIPHHLGGRTCECGLAPLCRRHHQAKQAPGWALTQNQPGDMTWTTPGRRRYTTHPISYPG